MGLEHDGIDVAGVFLLVALGFEDFEADSRGVAVGDVETLKIVASLVPHAKQEGDDDGEPEEVADGETEHGVFSNHMVESAIGTFDERGSVVIARWQEYCKPCGNELVSVLLV